jgi:hypothetical protein
MELLPDSRRVIADPVHVGQADGNAPYQALVIRPEFATEMLGQRQIVSITGCRQVESVGEHKRLKVQTHGVVELDAEIEKVAQLSHSFRKREPIVGSHALTQDVGYLEWQQGGRNDRLTRSECSLVESSCPIAPLLVQYPLDGHGGIYADHDN